MDSSLDFRWKEIMCPQSGIKRATTTDSANFIPACAGTTSSDRVPAKNVGGTVELVERGFQRRHRVFGDGLRRPAFASLHRTQRTVLAEQENLVHAHAKNLPGDVPGCVAEQIGRHRRDLFRTHLLDLLDALLLRFSLRRNGSDQPAPGKRRNAVRADIEALHVK